MTPLAKGLRTFAALSVGALGAAAVYDWSQNVRAGAVALGLQLLTAAIGGVVATVYALKWAGTTPWAKAFNTFWQGIGAGLSVVAFNSVADLVAFPRLFVPMLVGAVFGALQTFMQTSAEAVTPT